MLGPRCLFVGLVIEKLGAENQNDAMWQGIRVGNISMNSCLALYGYRWIHLEIFVDVCNTGVTVHTCIP